MANVMAIKTNVHYKLYFPSNYGRIAYNPNKAPILSRLHSRLFLQLSKSRRWLENLEAIVPEEIGHHLANQPSFGHHHYL